MTRKTRGSWDKIRMRRSAAIARVKQHILIFFNFLRSLSLHERASVPAKQIIVLDGQRGYKVLVITAAGYTANESLRLFTYPARQLTS